MWFELCNVHFIYLFIYCFYYTIWGIIMVEAYGSSFKTCIV
nr:MAG TPA: hypothetical protein [Caudoviricetes sp.]